MDGRLLVAGAVFARLELRGAGAGAERSSAGSGDLDDGEEADDTAAAVATVAAARRFALDLGVERVRD